LSIHFLAEITMEHISGVPREQITMFPEAVDDYISEENPVRFLDAFVDSLDTIKLGFQHAVLSSTGRPPFDPKDLLKLYLYGYMNRIQASRLLERETKRNLELFWLLKRLSPDHKSICNFRKDNPGALRGVFKEFVQICQKLSLFSNELVAVDSTKFKALNARDRVKDAKGLDKSIESITESIAGYLKQLDDNDAAADEQAKPLTKEELQEKINTLQNDKSKLQEAKITLQESGEDYISLTDPDCRLIKDHHGIEPAYRMQMATDSKHSLIVDYQLTSDASDSNHLAPMALAAKEMLGVDQLTVCADAGYYDSVDLKTCEDNRITAFMPVPEPKISEEKKVPTPDYYYDKFIYDESSDTYRCPQGQTLRYYTKKEKSDGRRIGIYWAGKALCNSCPVKAHCTSSPRGRYIHRWEYEPVLERLKARLSLPLGAEMMKHRMAIVEHPFGTLKIAWHHRMLLLRGLTKIASEAALMNLIYNIRRAITIVGIKGLMVQLESG